jgi:hypothetical protein
MKARKRVKAYFRERERIGQDLLKRITIYTLLMRPGPDEPLFYDQLMSTPWFRETVDFYFNSEYELKYTEIMEYLTNKRLIVRKGRTLYSTVKP